jgi:hypothetical protein
VFLNQLKNVVIAYLQTLLQQVSHFLFSLAELLSQLLNLFGLLADFALVLLAFIGNEFTFVKSLAELHLLLL